MMSVEEIYSRIKCIKNGNQIEMYITTNRIIIAKTGNNLGWTLAFGMVGSLAAQHSADKKSNQLSQLTPESVLKSNKKNFDIQNNEIIEIEIKKPGTLSPGKITLKTHDSTYKFIFKDKEEYTKNINLFERLYKNKLIIK